MIVILTYFSDGSGKPEIEFIEEAEDQLERVALSLLEAMSAGKQAEVFLIESLDSTVILIKEMAE